MSRFGYRRPRSWVVLAIGARVGVITALAALMCFSVGLLCGIVGIALVDAVGGAHISMAAAYRSVAFPAGVVGLMAGLIGMIITEVRDSRRASAGRLARGV